MKKLFFLISVVFLVHGQAFAEKDMMPIVECFSDHPNEMENVQIRVNQTSHADTYQVVITNRAVRSGPVTLVTAQGTISDEELDLELMSSGGELVGMGKGGIYSYASFTYPPLNLLLHVVNCEK